jgi:hypothetical protein
MELLAHGRHVAIFASRNPCSYNSEQENRERRSHHRHSSTIFSYAESALFKISYLALTVLLARNNGRACLLQMHSDRAA